MFKAYHLRATIAKLKRNKTNQKESTDLQSPNLSIRQKSHFCTMVRWKKMIECNAKPWVFVHIWVLWPLASYLLNLTLSILTWKREWTPTSPLSSDWYEDHWDNVLHAPSKIMYNVLKPILVFPIDCSIVCATSQHMSPVSLSDFHLNSHPIFIAKLSWQEAISLPSLSLPCPSSECSQFFLGSIQF